MPEDLSTELLRTEGAKVISMAEANRASDNINNINRSKDIKAKLNAVKTINNAKSVGVIGRNVRNALIESMGIAVSTPKEEKE